MIVVSGVLGGADEGSLLGFDEGDFDEGAFSSADESGVADGELEGGAVTVDEVAVSLLVGAAPDGGATLVDDGLDVEVEGFSGFDEVADDLAVIDE